MPAPVPPAAPERGQTFQPALTRQCNTAARLLIVARHVYLLHVQFLPEDRLAALMADLFGVRLTAATIARMSRSCAASLHGFGEAVRDLVAGASVKHMDETGFRIGGKTQWLHVASNAWLTFYRVSAKRGSLMAAGCSFRDRGA
jgi:transposase